MMCVCLALSCQVDGTVWRADGEVYHGAMELRSEKRDGEDHHDDDEEEDDDDDGAGGGSMVME
jgi:hypothetical protein